MYPHERSLVERLKNEPFALIGVNSDKDREELKKVMKEENITWRSFRNGGSTSGPISTRWNVSGWPTIYVIDAKGVIRRKGPRGEAMDRAVNALLIEMGELDPSEADTVSGDLHLATSHHIGLHHLPPVLRASKGKLPEPPVNYRLTEAGHEAIGRGAGRAKVQYAMLQALESGQRQRYDTANRRIYPG